MADLSTLKLQCTNDSLRKKVVVVGGLVALAYE